MLFPRFGLRRRGFQAKRFARAIVRKERERTAGGKKAHVGKSRQVGCRKLLPHKFIGFLLMHIYLNRVGARGRAIG